MIIQEHLIRVNNPKMLTAISSSIFVDCSLTPSSVGVPCEHGSSLVSPDPHVACAQAGWPGSESTCHRDGPSDGSRTSRESCTVVGFA